MQITFTAAVEDLPQYHWHRWARSSLRLLLSLCVLPFLAFGVCCFGGFGLLLSKISAAVVGIVPIGAGVLAVLDLLRMRLQMRRELSQKRVAEAGKFDFRWGWQGTPGYYHHWSYFTDLSDTEEAFSFLLGTGPTFRIPREAFASSEDADRFFALARRRWEAALQKQKQRLDEPDATVWPPPPRVG